MLIPVYQRDIEAYCPLCAMSDPNNKIISRMKIVPVKQGGEITREFWGCSNWPKCKHTVSPATLIMDYALTKTEVEDHNPRRFPVAVGAFNHSKDKLANKSTFTKSPVFTTSSTQADIELLQINFNNLAVAFNKLETLNEKLSKRVDELEAAMKAHEERHDKLSFEII